MGRASAPSVGGGSPHASLAPIWSTVTPSAPKKLTPNAATALSVSAVSSPSVSISSATVMLRTVTPAIVRLTGVVTVIPAPPAKPHRPVPKS